MELLHSSVKALAEGVARYIYNFSSVSSLERLGGREGREAGAYPGGGRGCSSTPLRV